MTLYQIYSHCVQQRYKASVFSKATLFQLVSLALTIICPLLVAYRSQGFWLKTNHYQEHPRVLFKHQFLILLKSAVNPAQYWIWSSFPALNRMEESRVRIPVLKSHESDFNSDGKPDRLHLEAEFPLNFDEKVQSVDVILVFDYSLELHSRFKMESLLHLSHTSALPGSGLEISGDLKLQQRTPLWYRGRDERFDHPPINYTELRAHNYRLDNVLQTHFQRNVTLILQPQLLIWKSAFTTNRFRVSANINYVTDTIQYYTGFWELIKWAWVQYLSILLVFLFVMRRVRAFVFQNRLVPTVPEKPQLSGPQ